MATKSSRGPRLFDLSKLVSELQRCTAMLKNDTITDKEYQRVAEWSALLMPSVVALSTFWGALSTAQRDRYTQIATAALQTAPGEPEMGKPSQKR